MISEKELNSYRLTSMEEPTDEMLAQIMHEAAEIYNRENEEAYLLDAMSYTEAESRIMHEMESVISGDYYISSLKKSNITELVPSEDENDDRWYRKANPRTAL